MPEIAANIFSWQILFWFLLILEQVVYPTMMYISLPVSSPVTSNDDFSVVSIFLHLCVFAFFVFVSKALLSGCVAALCQSTMTSVWSTTVTTMTTVWSSPTNRDLCQRVTDGLWPLLLRRRDWLLCFPLQLSATFAHFLFQLSTTSTLEEWL